MNTRPCPNCRMSLPAHFQSCPYCHARFPTGPGIALPIGVSLLTLAIILAAILFFG